MQDLDVKDFVNQTRRDYTLKELSEETASENPFEQFETWFAEAIKSDIFEPNAMTLATAAADGKPSARIVLLRGFDQSGFTFFTNYDSRKGRDLIENPQAALLFFWAEIERQVRLEGSILKVADRVSDDYFATRPRESQIGAWVSPQSETIESREFLERKFAELTEQWQGKEISRPPNWGGFTLRPQTFEFWQGRASRLHDRLFYKKIGTKWKLARLAP